jgi:hypothetical protein
MKKISVSNWAYETAIMLRDEIARREVSSLPLDLRNRVDGASEEELFSIGLAVLMDALEMSRSCSPDEYHVYKCAEGHVSATGDRRCHVTLEDVNLVSLEINGLCVVCGGPFVEITCPPRCVGGKGMIERFGWGLS